MGRLRRAKFAGTVGSLTVVVANVLCEHDPQVPLTEDQYSVGELGSDGADESFGEAVRPAATRRNLDHLDAYIGENSVEWCCELSSPISDEEPESAPQRDDSAPDLHIHTSRHGQHI